MKIIVGLIFFIIIAIIVILIIASQNTQVEKEKEKKEFAIPQQKRYPFLFFRDSRFYAEAVSRFAYSEEEIDQFLGSLEDAFEKKDYAKSIKLSNEIIKILPKADKVWLRRISSTFLDVITNEKCWNDKLSKVIVNSCFGFMQCYDNVIEKSIAVKHFLLPILIKNIDELIKYQNKDVTKYHNFEVYNMLFNLYFVIPYKEILGMLSNNLLEDKTDKDFESDPYVKHTLKSLLKNVDILRTRNTSRLQESFESRKITNCTLITDEKIEANIIAFELTFEPGVNKEKIEATFFDDDGSEIHFGRSPEERFVDIFEITSNTGTTIKEEIILLTDEPIGKVILKILKEQQSGGGDKNEDKKSENTPSKENSKLKTDNNISEKKEKAEEDLGVEEPEEQSKLITEYRGEMLMYPSFQDIKSIGMSDTQFVGLKENNTVISLGVGSKLKEQTNSWKNIEEIYVKDDAVYGVRSDGTVIYAGDSEYDGSEYLYSWQNVESLSLGKKHMAGLTKNSTIYALGSNANGECNVEEWYDIIQIATAYHTVGVTKNGMVFATGENEFGECDVKSWKDIVQVAAGDFYTLGLTSSGKVLSTGLNSCGQCNVGEWANIKKIFAMGNMTVGLRYDGKVVTAGKNSYHYGDVKNWARIKDIVMSPNRIVGIEQDGTVRAAGKPYKNFVNGEWQEAKAVVITGDNIVALKEDGTLISNDLIFGHCVSDNFDNIAQICDDLENNRIAMVSNQGVVTINDKLKNNINEEIQYPSFYDIKALDMSKTHIVMLKNNGTVASMRFSDRVVEDLVGWENIIAVKAGNGFLVGLDISGRVFASGDNDKGQCNVSEWHDIVKISASEKRAIGLSIDGKLYMSGVSEFGEDDFINISKNIKDFALTAEQTMILEMDGTVKVTYHPTGVNTEIVKGWKNIKKVVARGNDFLCLAEDGKVYSTIEDEVEITTWDDVDDIDASGNYVWASLKR